MVLVLIIGDLHIPTRIHDLPAKFKKLLVPGKIGQILCTGNICDKETYDYLRTIAPEVLSVKGDFDSVGTLSIAREGFTPPVIDVKFHNIFYKDWSLPSKRHHQPRTLEVWGHLRHSVYTDRRCRYSGGHVEADGCGHPDQRGTHRFEAFEYEGRFYVNPGSATGAWSGLWPGEATPSFALMDIQGPVVVTYVYQLVDGEVKVDKVEYRKPDPAEITSKGGNDSPSVPNPGMAGSETTEGVRAAGW